VNERWLTDGTPEARFPSWTRGNAGDVFPDPVTPLMWTFYAIPALAKGVRDAYISVGMLDWDEFDHPNDAYTFGCFGGYFYNPLSMVRLLGARMPGGSPEAIDNAYFDDRPEVPPYVAEDWHESERNAEKLSETVAWVMSADELPRLDVDKAYADNLRATRPDLSTLSDSALLARARTIVPYLQQSFETGMVVSISGSIAPGALGAICEALGDATMSVRLLAGIDVDSSKPTLAMWDLSRDVNSSAELTAEFDAGNDGLTERLRHNTSRDAKHFLARFDEFIADFGSRGPGEWDLNAKVWELHPDVALAAVDRMRNSPDSNSPVIRHDQSVVERNRLVDDIRSKLEGDATTLAGFDAAMRSAQLFLAGRERYKTSCIKMVHEIRMCFVELGNRMVERGLLDRAEQVFMLLSSELDEFRHQPERFTDLLRQREQDYEKLYELEPPFVVNGTVPPLSTWRRRGDRKITQSASGTVLRGAAGSGGVASGRARVILDASDPSALEFGEVLIAPNTDPAWTPLFIPAAAVVVNVGAAGSHSMIVCRELGIPCVVSVADATLLIPDGAEITVDGNTGTVTLH
jgi:rifampicin phosphotransferase